VRFKNAFKHASGVMAEVTRDAEARMAVKHALARPALPRFRAGDAVEISYAMESGEAEPMPVRGTVLGKWKRGLDSKFTVINSQDGEWYTASYVHSSPLLRGLKLMQRARWSEGLKRSRRAKLTHLLNADPRSDIVDQSTKEASVLQAEKEARRRQQEEMRRDAKRREEEEEAERQRLVELDRKERERIAKAEARRLRQKELLEEQQAEMKRKEEQKAEQERERLQRLEEKRQAQAEENARARARQQERIEQTLLQNQERLAQQRSQYLQKMQKEEERRQAFEAEKEAEILAKQQAGIEKREHIKQCQLQMEAVVQERKDGVMKKELHHEQMKQEADEVRQREQESKIAEREMRLYAIQLAHMRSQRRTEYQREVMASKIELEAARTDHLLQSRRAQLVQRKDMRSKSCRAKEDVTARMDKMRTSSSFDIDDEIRQYIQNPDLRELLDRCDEKCKGGKVPLDTMRAVLYEMQKEGKLLSGTR
jgi:hypothetical protein